MELEQILIEAKMHPGELRLIKENERLRQEVVTLKEQLKVYTHQDKLNSSRGKGKEVPPLYLKNQDKKSVSPKPDNSKKNATPTKANYQHFAQKIRSI